QSVAELGSGLRVGEDSAGIVIDIGGDEARPEDREEHDEPKLQDGENPSPGRAGLGRATTQVFPQSTDHPLSSRFLFALNCYCLRRSIEITSSAVMMPTSLFPLSTTGRMSRLYLSKISENSFSVAFSGEEITSAVARLARDVSASASTMLASGTVPTSFSS